MIALLFSAVVQQLFKTADGRNAFAYVLNNQRKHNSGLVLSKRTPPCFKRSALQYELALIALNEQLSDYRSLLIAGTVELSLFVVRRDV